jgi:hypothetical protein
MAHDEASSSTCEAWSVHRSANVDHTHLAVGDDPSPEWDALPASGNHWGAWAAWSTVYERPVLRGFMMHNLEHGGAVLSYRCDSPESEACARQQNDLVDLAQRFGEGRVIVTPDPEQPTAYAIRTWRWAYASDCLADDVALEFLADHYRNGREDIDADPPIPFDPTTTDVPCKDLMAAPDSCP